MTKIFQKIQKRPILEKRKKGLYQFLNISITLTPKNFGLQIFRFFIFGPQIFGHFLTLFSDEFWTFDSNVLKGKIDIFRALKRLLLLIHKNIYIKTVLSVRKDLLPRSPSQDLIPPLLRQL